VYISFTALTCASQTSVGLPQCLIKQTWWEGNKLEDAMDCLTLRKWQTSGQVCATWFQDWLAWIQITDDPRNTRSNHQLGFGRHVHTTRSEESRPHNSLMRCLYLEWSAYEHKSSQDLM
jgi:hypothetical protein